MEIMREIKYLGLFTFLILSSCISDIDFDVPGTVQDAIVIQAKVIKGDPSIVDVQVVNAFDFTGQSPTIRVSEAILENITSGQSISLEVTDFNARGAAISEGDPDMSINFTDEYSLTVKSANGHVFTSTPERLYQVPAPDSLTYSKDRIETVTTKGLKSFDDVINYKIHTPTRNMLGELSRLRWSFSHVYSVTDSPINNRTDPKICYVTDRLGAAAEINYDANILGTDKISNFDLIQPGLTKTYAEGSYFEVIQQSLSEGAYEYFNEIQELITRSGGVFDPPAGQIKTNFERMSDSSTDVFGYFYMTAQDTIRVFVDPSGLGPLSAICPPVSNRPTACPLAICCDCLDAKNSTTTKPVWWQ